MTGPADPLAVPHLVEFVELEQAPADLLSDTAASLEDPRVTRWLGTTPAQSLAERLAADLRRESLHLLLVREGVPLGWMGWMQYPPETSWVQTTVFLAPAAWGTGLLDQIFSLQWQVAAAASCTLIGSIHADNARSRAAASRYWPEDTLWEECFEPHKSRNAFRVQMAPPPRGYAPLTHPDLGHWVSRCAEIPLRRAG